MKIEVSQSDLDSSLCALRTQRRDLRPEEVGKAVLGDLIARIERQMVAEGLKPWNGWMDWDE